MVSDGGDFSIIIVGQNYTLIILCTVNGTHFTFYQCVTSGETGPTLIFSPLGLSDAGQYSCGNGTLSSDNITVTAQSE